MNRVYVLGEVMADLVAHLDGPLVIGSDTPGTIRLSGGGSAANTAAWLAHSGVPTTLIARVGDDPPGWQERQDLQGYGVDLAVSVDPSEPTGTCIVLVHATEHGIERTMVPSTGANAMLAPEHLPQFTPDSVLYVSGYAFFTQARAAALGALERARAVGGVRIAVGAASMAPIETVGADAFFSLIGTDLLLFANRDEAAVLSGVRSPADGARAIADRVGRAVVTAGAGGAYWADAATNEVVHVPAMPLEGRIYNTVGAGDAFAAGVLRSFVLNLAPAEALRVGHQLAARSMALPSSRP